MHHNGSIGKISTRFNYLRKCKSLRIHRCFHLLLFALVILSLPFEALAEDATTTVHLTNPEMKWGDPPQNKLPVLFVHGHDFSPDPNHPNYEKNWQEPLVYPSIITLPSFKDALDLPQNAHLGIEPYYIHFTEQDRSIVADAEEIRNAIERILKRHDSEYDPTDPDRSTNVQVVIIGYSKGTISTRLYLKNLQEERLSFHPVSEFVAIAPPNHGLASSDFFTNSSLALRQINNGYNRWCTAFANDNESRDFIENLNGHDIEHSMTDNEQGSDYSDEAPGSRPDGTPPADGILYVTLYANNGRDFVGGSECSDDCQGRILAKNLAPDAQNIEVPEIIGITSGGVHANTVHTPEVICKALYTAVRHQAPPENLTCTPVTVGDEDEDREVPILPPPGVVLLFDTSGSMSWRHDGTMGVPQRLTLAKEATYPFMEMLNDYNSDKANFGIAVFPPHPWESTVGCNGQEITSMTSVTDASKETAVSTTIPGLTAEGNTPLLSGVSTALEMFATETHRAIVLLSDGYHNCPHSVSIGDDDVTTLITQLQGQSVKVFTIGFGRPADVDHPLLETLAEETGGQFHDVTTPDFDPETWDPETDLQATYKAILVDALNLESAADPMGVIDAGETVIQEVKLNEHDRQVSFFLSWATPQDNRLQFRVESSDGHEIPITSTTPGVHFHEGKTYKIITVDQAFLQQPGKVDSSPWKIEIEAPELDSGQQEHYQYSVILDSELKMKIALDKKSYETGDSILLTARITEAGQPVTGLTNISVEVARPEDGAGNWFVRNTVSAEELQQIPVEREGETLSPVHRKALFLTDIRKVAFPAQIGPLMLQFYDDGTHGDVTANDGIYTTRFVDTDKEGTYTFHVRASGPTSGGNGFDREVMIQKYVTVHVDPEYSVVDVELLPSVEDQLNQFKITITPKDALGNYLGPRYSGLIDLTTSQGRFINTLQDNLDGTYSQILRVSSAVDIEDVDITVNAKDATLSCNLAEKLKKPYSFSLHVGSAIPTGNFNTNYDPDSMFGVNIDYHITSQFSLLGFLGYNRFQSGSSSVSDTSWWNLSANLKYEFPVNIFRPYVNGGMGVYIPENGSTEPGVNIGLGIDYFFSPNWILESGVDYHRVFTSSDDIEFFVPHLGLIYRF